MSLFSCIDLDLSFNGWSYIDNDSTVQPFALYCHTTFDTGKCCYIHIKASRLLLCLIHFFFGKGGINKRGAEQTIVFSEKNNDLNQ